MSVRSDASTDFLTYTGTGPAVATTGITVCFWAYLAVDRNDYSCLFRIDASGSLSSIETDVDGTTLWSFGAAGSINSGVSLTVGAWYFIALTVATNGAAKLYIVNAAGTVSTATGTHGTGTPTAMTLLGRSDQSGEWANARTVYDRVWAAVLTQAELLAERGSATPVRTSGLWADWPLTVHTDLTDKSGNGRDLAAGATAVTTEADPTLPTSTITRTIGQAVETDTATAVTRRKPRTIGQAVETDTAAAVARAKARTIATASSAETAAPFTRTKGRAAAQAATQELAQPVARVKVRPIGRAVDVATAQPLTRTKLRPAGQAAEASSATVVGRVKARPVGQAVEVDTAGPFGAAVPALVVDVDRAAELDEAHPIRPVKVVRIGQAVEAGVARPLARSKTRTVAGAVELSTAAAVTARHITRRGIGQAVELALAAAVGRRKVRALGRTVEHDSAGGVRNVFEATPPTLLTTGHAATATLVAAHGGRSRLEARHG